MYSLGRWLRVSIVLLGFVGCPGAFNACGGGLPVAWGTSDYSLTNPPPNVTNITAVAAGAFHVIVLNEDGTVSGWGDNTAGKASSPAGLANVTAIAAGESHSMALRRNGRVTVWGDNSAGQTNVHVDATAVMRIAAGGGHCLVLRSNGTVVAWGANGFGQATVPPGLANIIAVAGGGSHSLALRSDGRVFAWGQNTFGQSTVPLEAMTGITAIAAGSDFSLALRANGSIVAWGNPSAGRTAPPPGAYTAIAAGSGHGLAVLGNSRVVAWGSNLQGQTTVPGSLTNVVQVTAGAGHSVALRWRPPRLITHPESIAVVQGADATFSPTIVGSTPLLFRWRKNGTDIPGETNLSLTIENAQLTDAGTYALYISNRVGFVVSSNATLTVNAPVAIIEQPQDTEVVEGTNATLTVTAAGSIPITYRWRKNGTNIPGAVSSSYIIQSATPADAGNYTVVVSNSLRAVTSDVAVVTVHALPKIFSQPQSRTVLVGSSVTFEVGASNANAFQWRKNGTNIANATQSIYTINNAQTADAGNYTVRVSNDHGFVVSQLAVLTVTSTEPDPSTPIVLWGENPVWNGMEYIDMTVPEGLANVTGIAAGLFHQLALFGDGTVLGWGDNFYGQAGPPPNATNIVALSAGVHFSLGLTAKSNIVAWGRNNVGQLNVPPGGSNFVEIAAGGYHGLGRRANGKVVGWGLNIDGQAFIPLPVTNVTRIAAGMYHSLAVLPDGRVVGWGNNDHGQTRSPLNLSNVISIAAGNAHSLALKSDGTVVVWGDNSFGQRDVPANLSGVIAIAAGADHSLALLNNGAVVAWGQNNFGQREIPAGLPRIAAIAAAGDRSLALKALSVRLLPPQRIAANRYLLRVVNEDGSNFTPARVSRIGLYYSSNPAAPRASWTRLNVPWINQGSYLQVEDNTTGNPRFYITVEGP